MPGGISISTMSPSVIAEPFRSEGSVTVLERNTADTGLFRSNDVVAAKGVLARFKAFILRPGQAVIRWVHQLLHGPAPKAAEVRAVLTLETYKEALASKGGKAGLQQTLEQVVRWGRTSSAEDAKDAFGSVGGLLDVSSISERMHGVVAQGILKMILKGLANGVDLGVDRSVLESVAKKAAKIVVERDTKIDAKDIAMSVAVSVLESIEKSLKEGVLRNLGVGDALFVTGLVSRDVASYVARKVETVITAFVEGKQDMLAHLLGRLAKASDVIERRNVEAKSPAPMPTLDQLADMKTWLGPENSLERLGRLREGLLGIENEPSTPSSTHSAAARLLEEIRGYGMDFWRGGDQSIEAWFGSTSEDDKLEMAKKLNVWADDATELLLKPEAEKLQVKDQDQEASSRGFQYV